MDTTVDYRPGDLILESLTEISDGELLEQLDGKFRQLVAAVLETGNKGQLQLTLKVKRKGGTNQVEIAPTVKASVPDADIPARILFATEEGSLHRDDPNQGKLDLEDAPKRVSPVRRYDLKPAAGSAAPDAPVRVGNNK